MAKKRDIQRVEAVAREFGMTDEERREYGDYIEACKRAGDYGSDESGDFTFDELREKAREFRGD